MARYSRVDVIHATLDLGLVPVFYNSDLEKAKNILAACAEAGARVIEFTNRGDLAYRVFCDLIEHTASLDQDVILGVGSVIDAPTAALYINSGANFVVSPCLNPDVAKVCNRRKIAHTPGCATVSEISRAEEWGVEIVKVFPGGQVGGPAFVKAVMGPMPWSRIMPTGGVAPTRDSIGAWIGAGAAALGMGSKLIRKDLVEKGDWQGIKGQVADCLQFIREARQS